MADLSAPDTQESAPKHGTIGFNLAVIALCTVLVGLGLAYALDLIDNSPAPGPSLDAQGPLISKTIAGQHLVVPKQWFRFEEQLTPGFAEKIDLTFMLELAPGATPQPVNVILMPRSRARPSDRLLDSVYLHQFAQGQIDGPLGLIGKPLKAHDGFQDETVWYDPVSLNPFVAKCLPAIQTAEQSTCMRTITVSDQVAATYIFDANLLTGWKNFDPQAKRWLSRIGGI